MFVPSKGDVKVSNLRGPSYLEEQDKSSDIEQQPPFGDRKISNIQPQNRAGVQNQQEHQII